jgi:pyruvate formate lyase activating enzyme
MELGTPEIMAKGQIFNIQRYCTHDGPGIRTTVFFKGCPASCWWCHNPESQAQEPEILIHEGLCLGCGECQKACPEALCVPDRGSSATQGCSLCGNCVDACPSGARQKIGTTRTTAEVLKEIRKDRIFYETSGGGVTFSGGEPLLQPHFLMSLLEACRQDEIPTAVDTCGHAPREHLLSVVPLVDLFLFDLKAIDSATHQRMTGLDNALILDNLRALAQVHNRIWLRMPIIPGINDDDRNLEDAARFAAALPGVRELDLLPYHRTAQAKILRLGREDPMAGLAPPTPQRLEELRQQFSSFGLNVRIGG